MERKQLNFAVRGTLEVVILDLAGSILCGAKKNELVGSSKVMFSLELVENNGSITYLEDICGFLMADFNDEVLAHTFRSLLA